MGLFGLDHIVPIEANLYATAYNVFDNRVLPTLWQHFGEGRFLFQHYKALMQKARSVKKLYSQFGVEELDWPTQSADLR